MLKETQKEQLRAAIHRRLAELRPAVTDESDLEHEERLLRSNPEVGDYEDATADGDLQRTEAALRNLHEAEVAGLEMALSHLKRADFGQCADCGKPIPFDRLLVNPAVLQCGRCGQAADHPSESTAA
jgi:RNA polymerase-binding transcription factor DksA